MVRKAAMIAVLCLIAVSLGLYVYPSRPALIWALLGFCWICYRLSLRARALFGEPENAERH